MEVLPTGKSWCDDIDLYGKRDANCLEVLCEDGKVASVNLRIDYTTDYEFTLRKIIELCIQHVLIMLDEELITQL